MGILDYFRRTEYLYHGTRLNNVPQIKAEGLDPEYDRFSRGVVFLSDSSGFSAFWGGLEALIRVKKDDLNPDLLEKSSVYPSEYQYKGRVPPELLTIRRVLHKYSRKLKLVAID
jgi:hypothetical protein